MLGLDEEHRSRHPDGIGAGIEPGLTGAFRKDPARAALPFAARREALASPHLARLYSRGACA